MFGEGEGPEGEKPGFGNVVPEALRKKLQHLPQERGEEMQNPKVFSSDPEHTKWTVHDIERVSDN